MRRSLNALIFGVAAFGGQIVLRRRYAILIASNPKHRLVLRGWLIVYAFVGIQMGYVLRPFIGDPSQPVHFFRDDAWGNAYVLVAQTAYEFVRTQFSIDRFHLVQSRRATEEPDMFFYQRFIPGLAIASYLVGDEKTKQLAVIDPTRDVDEYISIAQREKLQITDILETHVHADFVSGARKLKARLNGKPRIHSSGMGGEEWTALCRSRRQRWR